MKIDGGCRCGKITYEAEADPNNSYVCNCLDCQTYSGSVFRWSITVLGEDFKLLSGDLKSFYMPLENGVTVESTFCPDCGSPLYSTSDADGPKYINIRVPTSKQHKELPPKSQYWKSTAHSWVPGLHEVEGSETG